MSELQEGIKFDSEDNKVRYDLVPVLPALEIAKVLTYGSIKYGDRNWEKGMAWTRLCGSIVRHVEAFRGGETYDPETGLHHLAHACCGSMFLMEYDKTHRELDDRIISIQEGEGLERFTLDIAQSEKNVLQKKKSKVATKLKKMHKAGRRKM